MTQPTPPTSRRTRRAIFRVTLWGALANLSLSALKISAGIWGHSQALVADGVHSVSDLATDAAILVGARFWLQPADERHPHGYAKIESLVTLFIGVALAGVSLGLGIRAVEDLHAVFAKGARLFTPSWVTLVVALVSMAVKEGLYRWTLAVGRGLPSSAVVANAWHHRSDAMSSIPVVLAIGLSLAFGQRFAFLDPVGALVVAALILVAAWNVALPAVFTLMDGGISPEETRRISQKALAIPGVVSVHRVRMRPLGQNTASVDLHLQVDGELSVREGHRIAHRVREALLAAFPNLAEVVAHVEPAEATCCLDAPREPPDEA